MSVATTSVPVSGGTLYVTTISDHNDVVAATQSFVPSSAGGAERFLMLTRALSIAGIALTATPGAGAFGITRTDGTSLVLTGEATSGAANKTDQAIWEVNLSDSYVAGRDIALTVNCNTVGTVITAASTTLTPTAYSQSDGVETALTVSAAQQIPATATDLIFTITGTGLTPGMSIVVVLTMLVTTSSGAAHGVINSVALTM